jgi:hypothetical protein
VARIAFWLSGAGALGVSLAACSDVGDSFAPGAPGAFGDDATTGPPAANGTHDAARDSADATQDTGAEGMVVPPADEAAANGPPPDDSGAMKGDDGGSVSTGDNSGATQGTQDTGTPDTGAPDAGTVDTGPVDTGAVDTGTMDTGAQDTGAQDSGASDAGSDAGRADTGADTGANDTGAGNPDATVADSGSDANAVDSTVVDSTTADTSAVDTGGTDPCDPITGNTTDCVGSRGAACLSCAQTNNCFVPLTGSSGNCESATGTATPFSIALPDGKTCAQVISPATAPVSEKAICLKTLSAIFPSGCAASTQATPCLCGTTDTNMCLAGQATPTGPAFDLYACDYNTTNGATITNNFATVTFGAGAANALVYCLGAYACPCF